MTFDAPPYKDIQYHKALEKSSEILLFLKKAESAFCRVRKMCKNNADWLFMLGDMKPRWQYFRGNTDQISYLKNISTL